MVDLVSLKWITTRVCALACSAAVLPLMACTGATSPAFVQAKPASVEQPISLNGPATTQRVSGPAIRQIDKEKVRQAVERYRINTGGKEATYEIVGADLDGDGTVEALVHVTGEEWCAVTGCTLLVMRESETGYDVVSLIKRVRRPIGISQQSKAGWRDLMLATGPSATQRVVTLRFNGSGYPGNASVLPPVQAGEASTPEIAFRAPPRTAVTAAQSTSNLIAGQN